MKYVILGWLAFVAFVYLLMWVDHFTHKHSVINGFRSFVETFAGDE